MTATQTITVGGDTTWVYNVGVRVRIAAERMKYVGGTAIGDFVTQDGVPENGHTRVTLTVANPAAIYSLNSGSNTDSFSSWLDYYFYFKARGGTQLTLQIDNDSGLQPQDVGGGTLNTDLPPYLGEYCQVDFVNLLEDDIVEEVGTGRKICRGWEWYGFNELVDKKGAER